MTSDLPTIAAVALRKRLGGHIEDHLGEGWIIAQHAERTFDPARGTIERYVRWIAKRRGIDKWRRMRGRLVKDQERKRRRRRVLGHEYIGLPGDVYLVPSPEYRSDLEGRELLRKIRDELGEELRLHAIGLTCTQIAAARDVPIGTVKSKIHRQRKALAHAQPR